MEPSKSRSDMSRSGHHIVVVVGVVCVVGPPATTMTCQCQAITFAFIVKVIVVVLLLLQP